MTACGTLHAYLQGWSRDSVLRADVAEAVERIATAAAEIALRVGFGPLLGHLGAAVGDNEHGDEQKALDLWANERLLDALGAANVAFVASEEMKTPVALKSAGSIAVAIDPLDGSSNIDTNVSVGTIFSVLPAADDHTFHQRGSAQLAAGYVIYGPLCALVLTLGEGTAIFTLDPLARDFRLTTTQVTIAPASDEYAINASNYRHWHEGVRAYIDDCIAGNDGPRGANVNMRWIASLVAECHRILARGGVFLYPADARKGYARGRLRLTYEANPIALLIEQAGGQAIDGARRILDILPATLHQRTPLMFGSSGEIERIARYKADPNTLFERSPLFGRRGLLRV
jgi:fructose-1,6-bisphosphatase I